jgi:hypothetical protein
MCAHDHARPGHHHHEHGGHHHHHHDDECCGPQCADTAGERNRYYTGKHMTARDFSDEQAHFLNRHRLHNRLMHGWGVVCGLRVERHPRERECPAHVVVSAGIAIDCCGREVVLREREPVRLWSAEDEREPDQSKWPDRRVYLLYIRYHLEPRGCIPVLYPEDCSTKRMEVDRVRDGAALEAIEWNEANRKRYAGCWPQQGANLEPCSKGCGAADDAAESCLEPSCPCALGVPLALITLGRKAGGDQGGQDTKDGGYYIPEDGIEIGGRKRLPPPKEYLTHIVRTNWEHGAVIPLSRLARFSSADMDGKLKIYFDRPLAAEPPAAPAGADQAPVFSSEQKREQRRQRRTRGFSGTGVNRSTFIVEAHDPKGDRIDQITLYDDENPPYWDPAECAAVFTINDNWLQGDEDTIADSLIHVTLKCDFVLDCNNLAVDGDFLGGSLPTGDGVEGGTFESWFWVRDDGAGTHYYRDEARRRKDQAERSRQQSEQGVQQ